MLIGRGVEVKVCLPSDREIQFTCRLISEARGCCSRRGRSLSILGAGGSRRDPSLRIARSIFTQVVHGASSCAWRMNQTIPFMALIVRSCVRIGWSTPSATTKPEFGRPEWLTTVTFNENAAATLVTHTILHKSREVRDGHLQAGMQEGMVQTLMRLDKHTASMEPLL